MNVPPKILAYSPSVSGGLAEYIRYQAAALEKAGAKVTCLVTPLYLSGRATELNQIKCLIDPPASGCRVVRKIKLAFGIVLNQFVLCRHVLRARPDLVLLDTYLEYLAPIWVWPHVVLARWFGMRYAATLHDPVRNFVVGPLWWHRLSVRLAYLPLDFVLIHSGLPTPSPVPSHVRVVQVPHGLFDIMGQTLNAGEVRLRWGVQAGQKVFLSFGYVRDGKNLDLAIKALVAVPQAFLVVAGSVASSKERPFAYYRNLAMHLGVADRCHFEEGFVADHELGGFFEAADFVLLTYDSSFFSQSGVLNIAAHSRKPVLASASPSPLIESVVKYALGIAVEPDSQEAVVNGMKRLLVDSFSPRWDDYEASACWAVNAQRVLEAAGLQLAKQP